jgi:hypothetical protein
LTTKRYYTFMIDAELADALRHAKAQTPERSEASIIREALREWLARHNVSATRAERKRASTRKRS